MSVRFETSDTGLSRLCARAETCFAHNLREFEGYRVLVEGGGYEKLWLETQPMGGAMAYKRDAEAGRNNVELFMRYQRADGRLPGSLKLSDGRIVPEFNKLQGFCFAEPALELYCDMGCDSAFLRALRDSLEAFDAYLWRTRNSMGSGVLESWCVCDTGEDGAARLRGAPFWWEGETPPTGNAVVPLRSMDVTGYSVSARLTLARVHALLGDAAKAEHWRDQAERLKRTLRAFFWNEQRGACFDMNADGTRQSVLCHNTLRLMYWGALTGDMADAFMKNLLDPNRFWTPFPLPSVAADDPLYADIPENNWSGQPEGLTYQRALRALERYGRQSELCAVGRALLDTLIKHGVFTQQFSALDGTPSLPGTLERAATTCPLPGGDYGPTVLAALEYIALLHGVLTREDEVWFGFTDGAPCRYEQFVAGHIYAAEFDGARGAAYVDGRPVAQAAAGERVVTDRNGAVLRRVPLA